MPAQLTFIWLLSSEDALFDLAGWLVDWSANCWPPKRLGSWLAGLFASWSGKQVGVAGGQLVNKQCTHDP